MDREKLVAALQTYRLTLAEDFKPPAKWAAANKLDKSQAVATRRTMAAEPLCKFFQADIPADLPFDVRQGLAALRGHLHLAGSPDGREVLRSIVDELLGPPVKLANEDRDAWIYKQCISGTAYKTIKARLAKKSLGLNRVDSGNPVRGKQIRQGPSPPVDPRPTTRSKAR